MAQAPDEPTLAPRGSRASAYAIYGGDDEADGSDDDYDSLSISSHTDYLLKRLPASMPRPLLVALDAGSARAQARASAEMLTPSGANTVQLPFGPYSQNVYELPYHLQALGVLRLLLCRLEASVEAVEALVEGTRGGTRCTPGRPSSLFWSLTTHCVEGRWWCGCAPATNTSIGEGIQASLARLIGEQEQHLAAAHAELGNLSDTLDSTRCCRQDPR